MADELQALLEKINEEGLKKADAEREAIVAKANKEATRIVEEAAAERKRMLEEARREAETLRVKGEESLRQAARDLLLSLREQLEQRLKAVAADTVREALTPDQVAGILKDMVGSFLSDAGDDSGAEVQVGAEQEEQIRNHLMSHLADDLRSRVELTPVRGISGGFRIQVNGEDVVYDFSDDALAEALTAFVNPRLAEILAGDVDGSEAESADDNEADA
jgi:V/A-type H+-transporting ATPase subunit E